MSHYTTEPAAKSLARAYPALAARLFQALGLRIVSAKKSKYYHVALGHLESACDCYLAAGQHHASAAVVAAVRREHGRKYTLMPGFERVAEGCSATPPRPSFLDRARSRWPHADRHGHLR